MKTTSQNAVNDTSYDRASMIGLLKSLSGECRSGQRVVSARLLGLAPIIASVLGGRVRDIRIVVDADDGDLATDIPKLLSFLGVPSLVPPPPPSPQDEPPEPTPPQGPTPGTKARQEPVLRSVAPLQIPSAPSSALPPQSKAERIVERIDERVARELQLLAQNRCDRRKLRGYIARNAEDVARVFDLPASRVVVLADDRTLLELANIVLARVKAFHRRQREALASRQALILSDVHAALRASARIDGQRLVLDGRVLLSAAMVAVGEYESWIALGDAGQCVSRKLLAGISRSYVAQALDLETWIEAGVLHIRHKAGRAGFRLPLQPAAWAEGVRMVDLPVAARKAA